MNKRLRRMDATHEVIRYLLIVLLLVVVVGPLLWTISLAFKGPGDNIYAVPPYVVPRDFTLKNFAHVFQQVPVWRYALNSLIVVTIVIVGNLTISSCAGFAFSTLEYPGRKATIAFLSASMIIPGEAILISQYLLIRGMHLNDTLLGVAFTGLNSTLNILLMMTAFKAVPKELYESAEMDGANVWQRFIHVGLPQVKGTMTVCAILTFASSWNDFLWPLIVLSNDEKYTLTVGLNKLQGVFMTDPRLIAAGAIVGLVPILIFFLCFQHYFFQGVQEGGIKG